ncbi:MAG: hypothetical protein EXR92_01125 [Gemmatimonadetes bacterium]|nr:hypothetical protein [Gemmatimonadota bacterium]
MRTTMPTTGLILTAVLALFIAVPAAAQVAWDAPLMVAPSTPLGWGVYLVDPSPGNGIGVMGTWRQGGMMGFRGGLAEGPGDNLAGFGGVDLSGRLVDASDDFPLDVAWVTGAGLGFGNAVLLSFPVGVTVGRVLTSDDVRVNSYFAPRIVLDASLGDEGADDELDLVFAVDLGLDLAFTPSWSIRFGATVGDREALAIGFSRQ